MENIELLEHLVMIQGDVDEMRKRVAALENCVVAMNNHLALATATMAIQAESISEIMGNTVLPKNKTKGRVIPLSLVAREIVRDDV